MIKRARELMKNMGGTSMKMDGPMPEWLYNIEKVSVKEKVMVVCLMYYYLHSRTFSFHYICVALFERCLPWVNPEKVTSLAAVINGKECKDLYSDESQRVIVVLGNYFEKRVIELIKVPDITEVDIEPIANKLYLEYFVSLQ